MSKNFSLYVVPENELPASMVNEDMIIRKKVLFAFNSKYSALNQELAEKFDNTPPDTEENAHIIAMAYRCSHIRDFYNECTTEFNQSEKSVEDARAYSKKLLEVIKYAKLESELLAEIAIHNS